MTNLDDNIIESILNGRQKPRRGIRYPCVICYKSVKAHHQRLKCHSCESLVHTECNNISDEEYEILKISNDPWYCLVCNPSDNLDRVPLTQCNNTELSYINQNNSMNFLESLPMANIVSESMKYMSSNEINLEIPTKSNCRYYSVEEYKHLKKSDNIDIFYANVNGLDSNYDNLHEFLSSISKKIDIVVLTETSEKEDASFLTNIEIEGYVSFHTATQTSKGGTIVNVNKDFDSIRRNDLEVIDKEFESTWIEIKNKHSKNIVVGCIYRHPHNNHQNFFQYLESCFGKLAKENNEIYICGDFNYDLIKMETDHTIQNFFNLLCSYGFLPHYTTNKIN